MLLNVCCCCWMFCFACFIVSFCVLFLCFFVSSGPSCIGKTITVCGTSWVRRWPTAVEVNKPFPRTKKHCPLNPSRWHVLIVMPTLLLVSALCLCIVFPHLVSAWVCRSTQYSRLVSYHKPSIFLLLKWPQRSNTTQLWSLLCSLLLSISFILFNNFSMLFQHFSPFSLYVWIHWNCWHLVWILFCCGSGMHEEDWI